MNLIIVDDEKGVCFALEELFKSAGYDVVSVLNGEEALFRIRENSFDIAVIDYQLPGMNGISLLKEIKAISPSTEVIIMTGFGSEKISVEAIKNGAFDFVAKPFNNEEIINRVSHVRDKINAQTIHNDGLGYYFSQSMKQVIDTVKTVAIIDTPILITGDSGTGKELLAKAAHMYSGRKGRFIPVNCGAIPQTLIESEFFGAEKGAYTGAGGLKKGFFELAENGTIFLDEIGEMPLELQVKILRVLQESEITRVGSGVPIKINARIIAATNKDLEKDVAEKLFREDLYYRLNVVRIRTKSLSERRDEIEPLSEIFLKEYAVKYQKKITGFTRDLMNLMINHTWNGNIRELKNKIENAVIFCKDNIISVLYLQLDATSHAENHTIDKKLHDFNNLPDNITRAKRIIVEEFEQAFIMYHLEQNSNNVRNTADKIGLSRQDLYKKIKGFSK